MISFLVSLLTLCGSGLLMTPTKHHYNGYDIVNISWDPGNYNDSVWLKVLKNCEIAEVDNQSILDTRQPNTGVYEWHVNNLNYSKSSYLLEVTNDSICYGTDATLISLRKTNDFVWEWPTEETSYALLGTNYSIRARGFNHRHRMAYGLELMALVNDSWVQVNSHFTDNLNPNSLIP